MLNGHEFCDAADLLEFCGKVEIGDICRLDYLVGLKDIEDGMLKVDLFRLEHGKNPVKVHVKHKELFKVCRGKPTHLSHVSDFAAQFVHCAVYADDFPAVLDLVFAFQRRYFVFEQASAADRDESVFYLKIVKESLEVLCLAREHDIAGTKL